jgi:hypothetical protein
MRKGTIYLFVILLLAGFFGPSFNVYANSKPEVLNPVILPSNPLTDDDLVATYEVYDPDGDEIQKIEIKWYMDGIPQTFYDDSLIIPSEDTAKGELWYYTIQAFDGTNYSDMNQSTFIEIENSPPNIIALSPPISNIRINETEALDFHVQVEDPDGDFILIKWRLDGAEVSDSEYYLFETDYRSAGMHTLNLSVQDVGEDSYTRFFEWTIFVSNVNRPPVVTIYEPVNNTDPSGRTSHLFQIEVFDLDLGDFPRITWYLDGLVVQSGGNSYTYIPDPEAHGEHRIRVVVDDYTDSTAHTWTVRVGDDTNEDSRFSSDDVLVFVFIIFAVVFVIIILVLVLLSSQRKNSDE